MSVFKKVSAYSPKTTKQKVLLTGICILYAAMLTAALFLLEAYTGLLSDSVWSPVTVMAFLVLFVPLFLMVGKLSAKNRLTVNNLVLLAMLIAVKIVFSRMLSIQTPFTKFSFAFIPLVFCAMLLGPAECMILSGVSDFLGAILFPTGPYFPGYTLTAVLNGGIYGFAFIKKVNIKTALIAVLSSQLFCTLLLNTYWVAITTDTSFFSRFLMRLPQAGIMSIVQVVVILLAGYTLQRHKKSVLAA